VASQSSVRSSGAGFGMATTPSVEYRCAAASQKAACADAPGTFGVRGSSNVISCERLATSTGVPPLWNSSRTTPVLLGVPSCGSNARAKNIELMLAPAVASAPAGTTALTTLPGTCSGRASRPVVEHICTLIFTDAEDTAKPAHATGGGGGASTCDALTVSVAPATLPAVSSAATMMSATATALAALPTETG
jgi:hypothetical protein